MRARLHLFFIAMTLCHVVGFLPTGRGQTWTQTGAPSNNWATIACSVDGSKLVAATGGQVANGQIYTSGDAGTNWSLTGAPLLHWTSVASSADGTRLIAAAYGNGIYTSTNSGGTWTSNNLPNILGGRWLSVASSALGSTLAAVQIESSAYCSTNSGSSWSTNYTHVADLVSLACSADGAMLAAGNNAGWITTSTNSGASWTSATSVALGAYVLSLKASADGRSLLAVASAGRGAYS